MFERWRKKKQNKIPLSKYWTSRYVWTLTIGLIIIAIISVVWIRHNAFEKRLDMMKFMAEETAELVVKGDNVMDEDDMLKDIEVREFLNNPGRYMQMDSNPSIFVVNTQGDIVFSNIQKNELYQQLNPDLLNNDKDYGSFYSDELKDKLYMVKSPIISDNNLLGWVVFFELKGNLTKVNQQYLQLFLMIGTLGILGWLSIFLLSKRLARPITDVAQAAEKIKAGDYDVKLSENVREKEVYDLIQSFKAMATKLEQLEDLRSELLAGVTHELKTPVTSISGLLQAVNDGVVEGDEAKSFIDISLKETAKMKTMVEDLLAFNSFIANAVPLHIETYQISIFLQELIKEWEIGKQIKFLMQTDDDAWVQMDYIRLQQIFINLFNNAKHAMQENKNAQITIQTFKERGYLAIYVSDNGQGIPLEDQPYIFEKFFRGSMKKHETSGFGLGLPYSKMIAQAMAGDLQLVKSSSEGTTFKVLVKI